MNDINIFNKAQVKYIFYYQKLRQNNIFLRGEVIAFIYSYSNNFVTVFKSILVIKSKICI